MAGTLERCKDALAGAAQAPPPGLPAPPTPAPRPAHHAVEGALEAAHAARAQHQHVGALAVAVVHDVPRLGGVGVGVGGQALVVGW